jgi:hypothetical protein
MQGSGFGSLIQCFFDPWIRDGKNPDLGSGINIPDHISESLAIFWVKNIYIFLVADRDPVPL